MISSVFFTDPPLWHTSECRRASAAGHSVRPASDRRLGRFGDRHWGISWPPVGTFVTAYGENLMTADTTQRWRWMTRSTEVGQGVDARLQHGVDGQRNQRPAPEGRWTSQGAPPYLDSAGPSSASGAPDRVCFYASGALTLPRRGTVGARAVRAGSPGPI